MYNRYCMHCKKKEDYEQLLKCVNQEIDKQEQEENNKRKNEDGQIPQKEAPDKEEHIMVCISA